MWKIESFTTKTVLVQCQFREMRKRFYTTFILSDKKNLPPQNVEMGRFSHTVGNNDIALLRNFHDF